MKIHIVLLGLICAVCGDIQAQNYAQYVRPLIGTDIRIVQGKTKGSTEERGQIIPATGVPHSMTNWVAQTEPTEQKCHPPYYYFHDTFEGFRASHWMNGSCTQDYGSVTVMPLNGTLKVDPVARASMFEHSAETATPSYYSVLLKRYAVKAELTGLSRSAVMRFYFQKACDHYVVIDPNSDKGVATISVDASKHEICGSNPVYRIYQGAGKQAGFSGHFVVSVDAEIASWGIDSTTTNHHIAWVKLKTKAPINLTVRVGTSFTDVSHARLNLNGEIGKKTFDEVRKVSSAIWGKTLGQIAVEGKNEEAKIKFYTALYNAHFLPRVFSDADGSYPEFDGGKQIRKMDKGIYYADFSQWDTYRAVHPLFTILDSKRDGDMAYSLVLKGEQGGWLPIFPSWNSYTSEMIGDHCIAMIGDAVMKDIPGFDYNRAYTLMRKNAFTPNTDPASYRDGKGRRALSSYLKYGYVPLEDSVKEAYHKGEQVSRTLEYAYDDFVLAQVAKKLGKTDDYEALMKRAQNYRNVIDPSTGFARGRYANGSWITPFDENKFVPFITEGTPYHYTWYVPQDVAGLMQQIGGKEKFIQRLDTFFEGDYYWHGNEPCHHIAYLFPYAGEPWKTQQWVHKIIDREYNTTPNGLSGNDDAGQMSAWLVFSMMGFYPVCPGQPYYVLGSPSFDKCSISIENGKKFVIEAVGASTGKIYIQSATLNGQKYDKSYIQHKDIVNGGILRLEMGLTPNKNWASAEASLPPSLGN